MNKTFLLVADPGAPHWIVSGIGGALQNALDEYSRLLGQSLSVRPTVYVSYAPGEPHAMPWYHGDVLNYGTVRLSFVGKPWLYASSAASNLVDVQLFIAHEAFHFWDGGIKSEQIEPNDSWLEEGGAQLAALLTAERAGWLSSGDFLSRLNGNLQRCLLETGDRPWAALVSGQIGGSIYYDCGVTFNFMAAALRDPVQPKQGFFNLWGQLLRVEQPEYSTADFLRIATHGPRSDTAKNLEQALAGTAGSLSDPIERLFTALKIPVSAAGDSARLDIPVSAVLQAFLLPLLGSACGQQNRLGFWTQKDFIKVDVPMQCKAFARTKLLVGVGDFKLSDSPLATWHEAFAECSDKGAVEFKTLQGKSLSVPCRAAIPRPPLWLLSLERYRAASNLKSPTSAVSSPATKEG
ncbi:MAG: hypothetical protein ACRES7_08140 [Gammaproteobacteria bacterium]